MNEDLTSLRLRGVVICSFARSEATNLKLYRESDKFPGELRKGDCYLFISKGGNQVIFLFKTITLEVEGRHERRDGNTTRRVIDSRRLRLDEGTWHPYMLQNYANKVGLHLEGLKRFEQIHDRLMATKRAKR